MHQVATKILQLLRSYNVYDTAFYEDRTAAEKLKGDRVTGN